MLRVLQILNAPRQQRYTNTRQSMHQHEKYTHPSSRHGCAGQHTLMRSGRISMPTAQPYNIRPNSESQKTQTNVPCINPAQQGRSSCLRNANAIAADNALPMASHD